MAVRQQTPRLHTVCRAVTSFSECSVCVLSADGDRDLKILEKKLEQHREYLFCHLLAYFVTFQIKRSSSSVKEESEHARTPPKRISIRCCIRNASLLLYISQFYPTILSISAWKDATISVALKNLFANISIRLNVAELSAAPLRRVSWIHEEHISQMCGKSEQFCFGWTRILIPTFPASNIYKINQIIYDIIPTIQYYIL